MIIQAAVTFAHVGWLYIFVHRLDMGARGAGLASSISFFSLMAGMNKYTDLRVDAQIRD